MGLQSRLAQGSLTFSVHLQGRKQESAVKVHHTGSSCSDWRTAPAFPNVVVLLTKLFIIIGGSFPASQGEVLGGDLT